MMIRLEVWKFGSLHMVCDDDQFGGLEVYKFTCCVMLIGFDVWKFGGLHAVCDDDKSAFWKFTHCV